MKKWFFRNAKIALLLVFVLLVCQLPAASYAKTTQQKLDDALKEKENIEKEIDKKQDEIDQLNKTKKGLKAELKDLNTQLTEVSENLDSLEKQILEKEEDIRIANEEIEKAKETEEWQYECMVKRIQYLYVSGETDYLEILLSSKNFSELLNYGDYVEALADYDRKMMDDYIATREAIEEKEATLQVEKTELENLKLAAETEKSKVAALISKTSSSISQYNEDISQAEEEAMAYEAELKKQEEDIAALKKKIEEEKALSAAAAQATWRDISQVSFAEGDRKLLANIIYCEAGGESEAGKLAVGAVVINRVLSSKYPDSVVGVIYQPYQFSPVRSGRLELALSVDKATPACYKAADEAMAGKTNVGQCLYFRTPIDGLTGIQIGGHIFY